MRLGLRAALLAGTLSACSPAAPGIGDDDPEGCDVAFAAAIEVAMEHTSLADGPQRRCGGVDSRHARIEDGTLDLTWSLVRGEDLRRVGGGGVRRLLLGGSDVDAAALAALGGWPDVEELELWATNLAHEAMGPTWATRGWRGSAG